MAPFIASDTTVGEADTSGSPKDQMDQMGSVKAYTLPGSFSEKSDGEEENVSQKSSHTPVNDIEDVLLEARTGSSPIDNPRITVTLDGSVDPITDVNSDSAIEMESKNHEESKPVGKPVDDYFTDGAVPRTLSPILSESDSDVHNTLSMHKDSDMYIQAKTDDGRTIIFEVNSSILTSASPVFRKMMYKTSPRPDNGDWIINLTRDNAKALRHVLRILHYQFNNKDVMRARTQGELGEILMLVHNYKLGDIIYPFAHKWSADLTRALKLDHENNPNVCVQGLWVSWKLADLKNFRKLLLDVIFSLPVDEHGAPCGPYGEALKKFPWPQELLDAIPFNRLEVIRRILATLSEPIRHFMAPDETPNGRYCKSNANHIDCHSSLLGSVITSLNKARMWPVPEPKMYEESVRHLREIVANLRVSALIFPGRPPHEQHHMRCGLEHMEVLQELESFLPVLPGSILEDMKHRGQMMSTFDEEAWAPYKGEDKWEDINMNPEDPTLDDGWDE